MEKFRHLEENPEFVKHPEALERARKILDEGRIKIEDFADLYGEDTVSRDTEYVEKRKKQFSANDFRDSDHRVLKERAEIFEAILFQEGDGAMWFGENSTIILPSDYDDIHNGVDSLVEIERQNGLSIAALSLDVTFRRDVSGKIEDIIEKIQRRHLSKVKYYKSELGNMRGEVKNIPHFIIGVDGGTLAQLTNLFAERKSSQFASHPVQFQIIESIIIQADFFKDFSEKHGNNDAAEAYERMGRIFREIYESRNEEFGDSGDRDSFESHLNQALSAVQTRDF